MARRVATSSKSGVPRQTTQRRLREAAVQLFSQQGYASTSIRELGEVVGILPGSVYAHIDTKQSLLVHLIDTGIDEYLAATSRLSGTGEERLRALVHAHVSVIAKNVDQANVVFHQWRHVEGPERRYLLDKRGAYARRIHDIVKAGIADGSFTATIDGWVAVLTILGILNWTSEWYMSTGPEPVEVISDGLFQIIVSGLTRDRLPAADVAAS